LKKKDVKDTNDETTNPALGGDPEMSKEFVKVLN